MDESGISTGLTPGALPFDPLERTSQLDASAMSETQRRMHSAAQRADRVGQRALQKIHRPPRVCKVVLSGGPCGGRAELVRHLVLMSFKNLCLCLFRRFPEL